MSIPFQFWLSFTCLAFACLSGGAVEAMPPSLEDDVRAGLRAGEAGERHFASAYARYPALPAGSLEAIAYVQTRNRSPRPAADVDHGPRAWGPMGLYEPQLEAAARLTGVPAGRIRHRAADNVRAAAALLDAALAGKDDAGAAREATLARALEAYFSPLLPPEGGAAEYTRAAFAYDVLLALDRGFAAAGLSVAPRPVAFERAFAAPVLAKLRAPFVRLDPVLGTLEAGGYALDPRSETLVEGGADPEDADSTAASAARSAAKSLDYGPALWVASPYHSVRTAPASAVVLHTMQGSYAGTLSWFQNNPYAVSAHYLVRSSDGQVTQMVRDGRAAHHVRAHNGYTIGIEHEGYVDNAAWYTPAMYAASSALVRHLCSRHGIDCASAWRGAASAGVVVLGDSVRVKGHQHYSGNSHTDPGVHWDWAGFHALLNPGGPLLLDDFERSEGHFDTGPTYSGSTRGISAASMAERQCSFARVGACAERVTLVDNLNTSEAWSVRLLSASGSPAANARLGRSGRVGFWVHAASSGLSVAVGIDDIDGTERSTARLLPAHSWTWVEWRLDDDAQWSPWAGGNGRLDAAQVTLDAIWLYRAQTPYTIRVTLDEVRYLVP